MQHLIRTFIFFSLFICFLSSCAIWRSSSKCTLDKKTNTISGNETNQKEYYVGKRFIPQNIEALLSSEIKPHIEHMDFSRKANEKYCRYHIYGCSDTTWAKQTMADHIMDKYHVIRKDSTYLDTVLLLTVVNESKLDKVEDDCLITGIGIHPYVQEPHYSYECKEWDGGFFLPYEYTRKNRSFTVEATPRKGKYNYKTPLYVVEKLGLEAYSDILLERYGVTLKWDRVDTVSVPVYKYEYSN